MHENVAINERLHRFEIETDGGTAQLVFHRGPSLLDLVHAEVPPQAEGRGFGSALVRAAMEYAKEQRLRVIPSCPFVRQWLQRHHEYDDIVVR